MIKIAVYILLIFIYLGISKSFTFPGSESVYIKNGKVLSNFFSGAPLSILLVQAYQTGTFIKSYYHKYRVIYRFQKPYDVVIRTTFDFWEENRKYLGLSIFRRESENFTESTVPMPPGTLYIGNPVYGRWRKVKKHSARIWKFHGAYTEKGGIDFLEFFGLKNFTITKKFYRSIRSHLESGLAFHGLNNEFGPNSILSREAFPMLKESKTRAELTLKQHLTKFIKVNKF